MKKLFLSFLFLMTFSLAICANANAAEILCDTPKNFIDSMNGKITKTITDKTSDDKKKTEVLSILFREYVDINWIGKFVLGANWRGLKPEQQKEYLIAYDNYLIETYVPIFKDYNGEKVEFLDATPLKRPNEFLVNTKIIRKDKPEVQASYRIMKSGQCYKVYDIVAEGVSMLNTQRQDFGSIYTRKGYAELINILKNKAAAPKETATAKK